MSDGRLGSRRASGRRGGLALFRRVPALRGLGAALGAFALLVQIWLPWVHHPAFAAAGGSPAYTAAAFFGGELALCGGLGGHARDPSDAPGKGPAHEPPPCPICQALTQLASFLPPTVPAIAAWSRPIVLHDVIDPAAIIARPLNRTSQPRAPPAMT